MARLQSKTEASRERVLECAERLFMERGYEAVKLRHIADELNVRSASLYYYFPEGKQEMFQAVLFHTTDRIRDGLEQALRDSAADLPSKLRAAANYFLSQPKMDLYRMLESDLERVDPQDRRAVAESLYGALQRPLIAVFAGAVSPGGRPAGGSSNPGDGAAANGPHPAAGGAQAPSPQLLAGTFLASVQAVHHLRPDFQINVSKEQMAAQICDVLAAGVQALSAT